MLQSEGWEIVDIEPERIFRRGDKVTVRRTATARPPARKPDPAPFKVRSGNPPITWDSFTTGGKIAVVAAAFAVLALLFYAGSSGQPSRPSPAPERSDDTSPSAGYAEVICERAVRDELVSKDANFDSESTVSGQTVYVTGTADSENAFGVAVEISYGCVAEGEGDDLKLTSVDVRD